MAAQTEARRANDTQCSSLISTVSTSLPLGACASYRSSHQSVLCVRAVLTPGRPRFLVCADFASQLQERLQGMDAGGDVNTLVHELLAAGGGNTPGGNTPGGSQKPPVPQGRNSRPSSREVPKARNPLAPLPTDTRNRRPSSRQRDTGGTPGSYRKVPPVPEAPNSAGSDSRRPLSREQRRRVDARRKRESMSEGSSTPFGPSPTWSTSSSSSRASQSSAPIHTPCCALCNVS
jgi:hypothetical protein